MKKPTKKSRAYRARIRARTEAVTSANERALALVQQYGIGPAVRIVTVPYPPAIVAATFACAVEDLGKAYEQTAISLNEFAAAIKSAYPKRRSRKPKP